MCLVILISKPIFGTTARNFSNFSNVMLQVQMLIRKNTKIVRGAFDVSSIMTNLLSKAVRVSHKDLCFVWVKMAIWDIQSISDTS